MTLNSGPVRAESCRQGHDEVPALPAERLRQKDSWPLMLFLHGAGERGDDLELVKKHGPPKLIEAGKDFPFIVVSPQCPQGRWWEPVELATLLDEIVEKQKVDKDRIYVTGLSMGGFGTWSLAAFQPGRFAAIVPICGGGEPLVSCCCPAFPPGCSMEGKTRWCRWSGRRRWSRS